MDAQSMQKNSKQQIINVDILCHILLPFFVILIFERRYIISGAKQNGAIIAMIFKSNSTVPHSKSVYAEKSISTPLSQPKKLF